MRSTAAVLAVAGLMMIAAPLMAQTNRSAGSIIDSPQAASIPDDPHNHATAVLYAFGRCAAKDRSLAEKLLETVPQSKQAQTAAEWLAQTTDCLNNGQLRFPAALLRGPVAEYLFARMKLAKPADWAKLEVFKAPSAGELAQDNDDQRAAIAMVLFGQCVAGKDMDAVRALLATGQGSAEESAAFGKLGPIMGGCAEKGVSLKVNRMQLRGYLAEGAYRAMVTQSKESGRAQG